MKNQNDEDDDKNKNGHNSAYFQTRTFRFCMIVDIYYDNDNNIYYDNDKNYTDDNDNNDNEKPI